MGRETRGLDLWGENPGVFFCPWVGEIWGPFLVCPKGFAPLPFWQKSIRHLVH